MAVTVFAGYSVLEDFRKLQNERCPSSWQSAHDRVHGFVVQLSTSILNWMKIPDQGMTEPISKCLFQAIPMKNKIHLFEHILPMQMISRLMWDLSVQTCKLHKLRNYSNVAQTHKNTTNKTARARLETTNQMSFWSRPRKNKFTTLNTSCLYSSRAAKCRTLL